MNHLFAVVRFEVEGMHYWPDPPARRAYLGLPHRHIFKVEARVQEIGLNREVEYHDLLDLCKDLFPGGDLGSQSCEMMAAALAQKLSDLFPGRSVSVSIFEDGECGALCVLEEITQR